MDEATRIKDLKTIEKLMEATRGGGTTTEPNLAALPARRRLFDPIRFANTFTNCVICFMKTFLKQAEESITTKKANNFDDDPDDGDDPNDNDPDDDPDDSGSNHIGSDDSDIEETPLINVAAFHQLPSMRGNYITMQACVNLKERPPTSTNQKKNKQLSQVASCFRE